VLTISDTAHTLSIIDSEVQELEADLRAIERQRRDLQGREHKIKTRVEILRILAIEVMREAMES